MDIVFVYNSSLVDSVRKLDILKYQFRSIAENIPELDNIFFVVNDKTEFENAYTNITFIEYKDIVPDYILNTTEYTIDYIDLYITNIPNLSENFIYIRENWFFLRHKNLFYDNFSILNFYKKKIDGSAFNKLINGEWGSYNFTLNYLLNNNKITTSEFDTIFNSYQIPYTLNVPIPLIKSKIYDYSQYIINAFETDILFREKQLNFNISNINNLNYLLYIDYTYYLNNYIPETIKTTQVKLTNSNDSVLNKLNNITVNDCFLSLVNIDKIKTVEEFEEKKILVNNWLEQRFPNKCKYEI